MESQLQRKGKEAQEEEGHSKLAKQDERPAKHLWS